MKKIVIIVFILFVVLFSFGQKNGFLKFKIPKESYFMPENYNDFLFENDDNEQVYVYSSQTSNLNNIISQNFVYNDSVETKIRTGNYEYSKFTGKNISLNVSLELYLFNQESNYIAVIRYVDNIDDKTFMDFLSSVEIIEKEVKWKKFEYELFTMYLPDLDAETDIGENISPYQINGSFEEDGWFEVSEEFTYSKLNDYNSNSSSFQFLKQINGQFYSFDFYYENDRYFSKEFYEKIKNGIKPKIHQPQGNVLKVSGVFVPKFTSDYVEEWNWLFVANKKKVTFWGLKFDNNVFVYKKIKGNPTCVADINYDEYKIIGDDIGNFYIYNDEAAFVDNIELEPHSAQINQIGYDNGNIISCSDDNTLKIQGFDYLGDEVVITCNGHTDAVTCFDHDGSSIISGSKDNSIILWNDEGQIKSTLNFHSDDITAIKVFEYKKAISASKDGVVKIWNTESGEVNKTFNIDNGYATCFEDRTENNNFGEYYAIGTSTGEIIVGDVNTYETVHIFKDDKAIKLIRFYDYGLMTVNIDNEVKFWEIEK